MTRNGPQHRSLTVKACHGPDGKGCPKKMVIGARRGRCTYCALEVVRLRHQAYARGQAIRGD